MSTKFILKVVVVGEFAVGKTSLVKKFVSSYFTKEYIPTIGANMYQKTVLFKSNSKDYDVNLNVWDIAGQQNWNFMRKPYISGSQGALIVCDLSREETLDELEKVWLPDLRNITDNDISIILIANKSDLSHAISEKNLEDFLIRNQLKHYIISSAKYGKNVEEAFQTLVKEMIKLNELLPI